MMERPTGHRPRRRPGAPPARRSGRILPPTLPVSALLAPALAVCALLAPGPLEGQSGAERWVGEWRGVLVAGPQELPLVFHIAEGQAGLSATMDSPAQGAFGVPLDGVHVSGDSIALTLRAAQARYDGVLGEDGALRGEWTQGPGRFPLDLVPSSRDGSAGGEVAGEAAAQAAVDAATERALVAAGLRVPDPSTRPQTPKPPFPYRVEEVSFAGGGDFRLAGTLTLPGEAGPHPGVVLVSGSGPQDRDETLLGHKPFAVLADHLTRAGIAVLRYDDRGVGGSGGDFASATTDDLAADAQAALGYLRDQEGVDPARVGMVGHSEGGLIGPMVAARSDQVAFLVLLAGPGLPGAEVILDQSLSLALAEGVPEEMVERSLDLNRALFDVIAEEPDPEAAAARMAEVLRAAIREMSPQERALSQIPEDGVEAWVQAQVAQLSGPWLRFFVTYDPVPALEATTVPVLALNGELDLQVTAESNLEAIEGALARAGNPDVTVRMLPGLNHLFQNADTGSSAEYALIDETMAPEVMELVAGWILQRFGGR